MNTAALEYTNIIENLEELKVMGFQKNCYI